MPDKVQDLFIEGPAFVDSYVPLSTDMSKWPDECSTNFFSNFPFLKTAIVRTKFTRTDEGSQSALGAIEAIVGNEKLNFPLIVKGAKLSPFDVFIYNNKYYPATQDRIDLIMSGRGMVADTTMEPERSVSVMEATMLPDMLTDQDTRYQKASSQDNSLLSKIAFTVNSASKDKLVGYIKSNPDLVALAKYPSVMKVLKNLTDLPVLSDDQYSSALSSMLPIGVLQIRKTTPDGTYTILTNSRQFFHPVEHNMTTQELDTYLKSFLDKSYPIIDAVDQSGEVTVSFMDDAGAMSTLKTKLDEDLDAKSPGTYVCKTENQGRGDAGGAWVKGQIVPIFDYNLQSMKMSLFYNSSIYSIQDKFAGEKKGEYSSPLHAKPDEPAPGMTGSFLHKHKPIALLPFTITSTHTKNTHNLGRITVIKGVSITNEQVKIEYSDGFKGMSKAVVSEGDILSEHSTSLTVSSNDFIFVALGDPTNLSKFPNQFSKEASFKYSNRIRIRKSGDNFIMDGFNMEKYASVEPMLLGGGERKTFNFNDMSHEDSKFFLSSLGFKPVRSAEILKKASLFGSVEMVKVAFPQTIVERKQEFIPRVKSALAVIPAIRPTFIKQAAATKDEKALDQTLALNLMAPENALYFVSAIPDIQNTVEKLAALLTYTRLGLQDIPEQSVRDTMTGLDQTLSVLKLMKLNLEKSNTAV